MKENVREKLKAHDVVATVHVNRFARDARPARRKQEYRGRTDLAGIDVAPQGRLVGMSLEHVAEVRNAARGQGLDRAGGDGIDANFPRAEIAREIADARLQRG